MVVDRNVIFNKAGGNSGKGSFSYKISIPADMIKELGVTEADRTVRMTLEGKKIIIEKIK